MCVRKNCADWKGYYVRGCYCTVIEYIGPIVIHCGRCTATKKDFSYLPTVLIPYKKVSKLTYEIIYENYEKYGSVKIATEEASDELGDEFYLSYSTTYKCLYFLLILININLRVLGLKKERPIILSSLKNTESKSFQTLFQLWKEENHKIVYPP